MTVIPGLTPGQLVPWNQIPQGMYLNTPRNYGSAGGLQRYDPNAATMGPMPAFNQGQMAAWQTRGAPKNAGTKPGGAAGTTAPNYGRSQGLAQGAQGPGFNVQTGITAGPVLPQNIVQSEQNRLRSYQPASIGAPFMQHLNDLVGGAMNTAAMDFGRDASFANAQQLLASQQARANAGLGWGGAALGDYASQRGSQLQGLNALITLLQQFMV